MSQGPELQSSDGFLNLLCFSLPSVPLWVLGCLAFPVMPSEVTQENVSQDSRKSYSDETLQVTVASYQAPPLL